MNPGDMFLSIGAIIFGDTSASREEVGYLEDGEMGIVLEFIHISYPPFVKILGNNGSTGWVNTNRLVNISGVKICNTMGY